MVISTHLRDCLQQRVADCLADDLLDEGVRRVAERKQAFVIYADLGGAALLDLDGRVWMFAWDGEAAWEDSAKWRLLALVIGAERFPELKELLPVRPALAPDCSSCQGTGTFAHLRKVKCWECAGLGWLSDESGRTRQST